MTNGKSPTTKSEEWSWKDLPGHSCPDCGERNVQVFTNLPEGTYRDYDTVECKTCGEEGTLYVDENGTEINWKNETEES